MLQAVDLRDGAVVWSTDLRRDPGVVQVAGAANGIVVALEFSCDVEVGPKSVAGFDAGTGKRLWSQPTRGAYGLGKGGSPTLTPALGASPRGVVWVEVRTTDEIRIRAADLRTGRQLWEARGTQASSWPLAGNRDVVVFGPHPNLVADPTFDAPERTLRAIDRRTGAELWKTRVATSGARSMGAATTADAVIAQVDNRLVGIDIRTGRNLWSTDLPVPEGAYNQAWIGAADGVAVVTQNAGEGRVTATGVDAATGQLLWSGRPEVLVQSPQPTDRYPLATVLDSVANLSVALIDPRSGNPRWLVSTTGFPNGIGPMSSNTQTVVPQGYSLAVVDPGSGTALRTISPPPTSRSAIIAGNRLVFAGGCTADPEEGG